MTTINCKVREKKVMKNKNFHKKKKLEKKIQIKNDFFKKIITHTYSLLIGFPFPFQLNIVNCQVNAHFSRNIEKKNFSPQGRWEKSYCISILHIVLMS